jgi:hypothetical protein
LISELNNLKSTKVSKIQIDLKSAYKAFNHDFEFVRYALNNLDSNIPIILKELEVSLTNRLM